MKNDTNEIGLDASHKQTGDQVNIVALDKVASASSELTADEFQKRAMATLTKRPYRPTPEEFDLTIKIIKLAAFGASMVEYIKKAIFHEHGFDPHEFNARMGAFFGDALANGEVDQGIEMPEGMEESDLFALWGILGLLGETGEIANVVMEGIFDGWMDTERLTDELGDNQWYAAALATSAGLPLGGIMQQNNEKLSKRYAQGFSTQASQERVDVK